MTRPFLPLLLLLLTAPALTQTPPDPFQAHLQAGQTALRAGLPLLAAREYRAAVRLRPADADAHYALAGVLEAAGRADEAADEYRRTIALRPDNAPAHNALAGLLEDQGESEAALAQYRQAIALLPSDPRLRFNLGGALADGGQRSAAAAQYREALRLKPDFADAAQALRALGSLPDGGGGPKNPPRSLRLAAPPAPGGGRGKFRSPRPPAPGGPTSPAVGGLSQALALAHAGRLREAVAAFRAVLARHPRDADARLHLGITLYADGQTAQARREWSHVLTLGNSAATAQTRRLLARYP